MSRRNSGVFYYSDVAEPADVETKDQKFNTITAAKSPKLKSSGSSKDITFTVINNAIAGETQQNGSLAPLPSNKLAASTNAITIPGTPGSPSRTRSQSTPPLATPENLPAGVALKSSANLHSIQENGHAEAPPPYDSLNGASKDDFAPASPNQTASKPPKVLKRNPSFWEIEPKKGKNQMTLRRYTDVGIVTVTLNVSGTIFATSTNTLLREQDTLFATILEREETSIRAGKQIFLDRNPKYFSPILDYMRTGSFDRDAHIKYAKSIMVEAEFFKVKGLIKLLHEVPELSRTQVLQLINASDKPKLRGLWLPTVNLAGLDLTKANLDFSQLGRCNFRNVLLGGASICNASMVDINLRNAILNHATIANTDFNRANISNSTLRFVKCQRCDFTDADLSFCAFEGSDFHGCDFTGANLTGADFTSADLTNSVFRNAIFSEDTVFGNTITKNVDYEGSNIEITKKKGGVFAMLGKKKKG